MLKSSKYNRLYLLYLFIGLVSYLFISFDIISGLFLLPGLNISLNTFWQSTFTLWFLVGHFLFIKSYFEDKEIYNVERLLAYILGGAFITTLVVLFPDLTFIFGVSFFKDPVLLSLYNLAESYLLVIFFLTAMVLYLKLVYVQKNKRIIIQHNVFVVIVLISAIFTFPIDWPEVIYNSFIMITIIIMLLLTVRLKWVALLKLSSRWACIFILTACTMLTVVVTLKATELKGSYIFFDNIYRNMFLLIIAGFVNLYGIFSLLGLVFNLPIASIIDQKAGEISSFQQINQILHEKMNVRQVIKMLLTFCITNTRAEGGAIIWYENDKKEVLFPSNISEKEINNISLLFHKESLFQKDKSYNTIYISNARKDDLFKNAEPSFKSYLAAPVFINNKMAGELYLTKTYRNGFDEYMIRLVRSYINQTKMAIENAYLLKEAIEKERLQEELEIARNIQMKLLPKTFPEDDNFNVIGWSESAKEVGGDYFDWYKWDENRYAFVIGDVSGKGTSAAFHMAELKGIFQSLAPLQLSSSEFLQKANDSMNACLEPDSFVTLIYLVLDSLNKKITYSPAGHCPLIVHHHKRDATFYDENTGLGLGITSSGEFKNHIEQRTIEWEKGDLLLLYTDGVTECRSEKGEEFGYDRLLNIIRLNNTKDIKAIQQILLNELSAFSGKEDQMDDMTFLLFRF